MLDGGSNTIAGYSDVVDTYKLVYNETALFNICLQSSKEFKDCVLKNKLSAELKSILEATLVEFPESQSLYDWKILSELGSDKTKLITERYI